MSPVLSSVSRRGFLTGGALVVSFALAPRAFAQLAGGGEGGAGPAVVAPDLKGSLKSTPGSASTPMAGSPSSPARWNWARASAPL